MKTEYDIIIIGLGPAGISAALYAQRAGMRTLAIGEQKSALHKAEKIDNYYGVVPQTTGKELFENGIAQAKAMGVDIVDSQVVGLSWDGLYQVKTPSQTYIGKSVIVATGMGRKSPKIKGLAELEGMGVSYCAVCDGFFYKGKAVAVIGNGAYAVEEAEYLKNIAQEVYILPNGEEMNAAAGDIVVKHEKITEILGDTKVEQIQFENGDVLDVQGVFVAIGTAGASDFAKKLGAELNGNAIKIDETGATNLPGLYAAGDTAGGMLQVAKAVYQGAVAGTNSVKFVRGLKG